jgi:hypothetical protein
VTFYAIFAIIFGEINTGEAAKLQFLKENPDLVALSNEIIICFGNHQRIINACFGLNLLLTANSLNGIVILIVMFFRIRSTRTLHKTTYKLQIMMYRALAVQLFTHNVFFLIPCRFFWHECFLKIGVKKKFLYKNITAC